MLEAFKQSIRIPKHSQVPLENVKRGMQIVSFNKFGLSEPTGIVYASIDVSDLYKIRFYDGNYVVLPGDWLVHDELLDKWKMAKDIQRHDTLKAYASAKTVSTTQLIGRESFKEVIPSNRCMYINDIAVMTHTK